VGCMPRAHASWVVAGWLMEGGACACDAVDVGGDGRRRWRSCWISSTVRAVGGGVGCCWGGAGGGWDVDGGGFRICCKT
jgi:hypothetical protein